MGTAYLKLLASADRDSVNVKSLKCASEALTPFK